MHSSCAILINALGFDTVCPPSCHLLLPNKSKKARDDSKKYTILFISSHVICSNMAGAAAPADGGMVLLLCDESY